ncbi:S-adenosyl-L-methionine-dependent methyltransferase [Sporodiniella umbellata]|nr:S-adenosyl-L-methionine-dependent methyltransferase [Sporodiniella umbellata]
MGNVNSKKKHTKGENDLEKIPTETRSTSLTKDLNSSYWLTDNSEETDRLNSQHFALKALYDGNFSTVITEKLDMDCTTVLDLGCGPGAWLMDTATEFSNSQFYGIDIRDLFPTDIRPPNVHFQVHDALIGLPFPDNSFDIVNTRTFILSIQKNKWPFILNEITRVLKPGGFAQICEYTILETGTEFVQRVGEALRQDLINRNLDPSVAHNLDTILKSSRFDVLETDRRDICLAQKDSLTKEFLWNILKIYDFSQLVLCASFGYMADTDHVDFRNKFENELSNTPNATWSFFRCVAQKPIN